MKIIKKKKNLLVFICTIIIDINPADPDPVFPLFLRFYWDDSRQENWIPSEMDCGKNLH